MEAVLENRVLRARARGEASADDAFESLYREYGRIVFSWLAVRTDASAVDDLAQDVWLIFYSRFRSWEFGVEKESPEARPVLSFLFRTCQYVARGHGRLAATRRTEPLEAPEQVAVQDSMLRKLEATRVLAVAKSVCAENECCSRSCRECRDARLPRPFPFPSRSWTTAIGTRSQSCERN